MEQVALTTLLFSLVFYFIPTIIAFCRGHNSKLGILAMNLILGWTFIFWLWSLIWSLCGNGNQNITIVNNQNVSN